MCGKAPAFIPYSDESRGFCLPFAKWAAATTIVAQEKYLQNLSVSLAKTDFQGE